VNEMPTPSSDDQKKQVMQVRQFLKQANDALKTGDAEGADNLATKAGLLLDDIK
jgi:ABC-type sugar transport system substrate-binding protein